MTNKELNLEEQEEQNAELNYAHLVYDMSKSQLRKEYEARFGVQKGWLELYDAKGNLTYREESTGFWVKYECDDKGNVTYSENSEDYWVKREYDDKSNYKKYHCRGSRSSIKIFIPTPTCILSIERLNNSMPLNCIGIRHLHDAIVT